MKFHTLFLQDILAAMDKIERFIQKTDYDNFARNELVVDAVLRNLEIIGEASRNIPENLREKYPDIPWRRMIGLRNLVIHEYFGVDLQIIWTIVVKNIPETKQQIKLMLEEEQSQ